MGKYIDLFHKVTGTTYDELYIKQNLPREFLFSLTASGWGGSGPYTQNVSIQGITANTTGIIGVNQSATAQQYNQSLYAQLRITGQTTNQITVTAYGVKPTVDIPCVITCSSNMKLLRNAPSVNTDTVVG